MIQTLRPLVLLTVLALLHIGAPGQALAQATPEPPKSETQEHLSASVQQLSDKLTDIEKRVDVQRLTPGLLTQLSTDIAPLVTESQAIVERLTPRVAALKARLDQLGTKPEKGESADISKERDTLDKGFTDSDGLFKRAKVLVVKAQQDSAYIAKRQRSLFTTSLFQRSTSILSPPLWATVAKETPDNFTDATRIFRDWLDGFNENLTGGKPDHLLGAGRRRHAALLAADSPSRSVSSGTIRKSTSRANGTRRSSPAGQPSASRALMIAIMYGVVYVFSFFSVARYADPAAVHGDARRRHPSRFGGRSVARTTGAGSVANGGSSTSTTRRPTS